MGLPSGMRRAARCERPADVISKQSRPEVFPFVQTASPSPTIKTASSDRAVPVRRLTPLRLEKISLTPAALISLLLAKAFEFTRLRKSLGGAVLVREQPFRIAFSCALSLEGEHDDKGKARGFQRIEHAVDARIVAQILAARAEIAHGRSITAEEPCDRLLRRASATGRRRHGSDRSRSDAPARGPVRRSFRRQTQRGSLARNEP